jgi:hypothetical protein
MERRGHKSRVIAGGVFFLAHTLLAGCDDGTPPKSPRTSAGGGNVMEQRRAGVMTQIEETAPGEYRIIKEFPSSATGVQVKRRDGTSEILTEDRVRSLMDGAGEERNLLGLGTVLSSGLLGYMMGRNASLNPFVYGSEAVYRQSLASRLALEERLREEEQRMGSPARTYWYGSRYYGYSYRNRNYTSTSPAAAPKSGFFSRMTSGFRGFMG